MRRLNQPLLWPVPAPHGAGGPPPPAVVAGARTAWRWRAAATRVAGQGRANALLPRRQIMGNAGWRAQPAGGRVSH
ncbi:MAG: hypothetical protein DWI67_00265 [Chloroflexi bacterium]|nr:MAG: hypothetical protein DWI67_00265 [Chloroflexota bacterium]